MGTLLAQYLEETRKENAIYYINKKMLSYEAKYSPLDQKTYVVLVWATHKLRHYMLAYKVLLIAKWVLLLSEFDIKYVTEKSMKGRAIADHLAHCSSEEVEKIQ